MTIKNSFREAFETGAYFEIPRRDRVEMTVVAKEETNLLDSVIDIEATIVEVTIVTDEKKEAV